MTFSTTRLDRVIAAVVIFGALAHGVPAYAQSSAATAPLKVLRGKLLFKFHYNQGVQHEADVQAIDPYMNKVRLQVDPAATPFLVQAVRLGAELDLTLQLHAVDSAAGISLYQIDTTAHAVAATLVMATGHAPTLEVVFELPSAPTRSNGPILVYVAHGTPTVKTRMPIPSLQGEPAAASEGIAVCTHLVAGGVAQPVMDHPHDDRCKPDEVSSGRIVYNLIGVPVQSPGVPTAGPASQLTLRTNSGALRKVLDAAGSTCAPMNLSFRLGDLRKGGVPGLLVSAASVVNAPAPASGASSQTSACVRTPSPAPPGTEVKYWFSPAAPTSTITFENLSTHVVEVVSLR